MQKMEFRGRWVLVTGASAGLGREFARQLAREHGANLILVARRKERLEELRLELRRDTGVQVTTLVADLSEPSDCERVLAEIGAGPAVYGLILNAAVTHFGSYQELDLARFRALLHTNVTSVVAFANALIPRIEQQQPGGGVLFVSSMAGLQPVPFQSAYSGSKAFLIHYACGLWHELRGREVSITTFAPGGIVTEMTAGESFKPLASWLMPVEQCARLGIDAFAKRRYLYVPGFLNRVGGALSQLLPRRFVTSLVARSYRHALEKANR
ncbi:MAG: SDR family NAD(P)-dependent oxidoreductase [Polyangiaceae bacterium]